MANLPTSLNWLEDFGEKALATPVLQNTHLNSMVGSASLFKKPRFGVSFSQFSCTFETKSGPCGKVFPRSCDLKCVHQKSKGIGLTWLFRKHLKNHTRPIACKHFPLCKLRFPTLKDRDRHINSRHEAYDGLLRYCCALASCWFSIENVISHAIRYDRYDAGFARKDAWQSHMTTHKLSREQIREIRTKGIPTLVLKQGKWERGHLDTVQRTSKRQEEATEAINKAPARINGDSQWNSEKIQC
jgi:hypothetical protein